MDSKLKEKILKKISMPRLFPDRALIITKSYKKTVAEPMIIRKAKALKDYVNKMPISIENWQLIVGNFSSKPFGISPFPEACWKAVLEGLDEFSSREGDKYYVSEKDKKTLRKILPWWEGKSIQDIIFSRLPEKVKMVYESGVNDTGYFTQGSGNFSADYGKVIFKGFDKIKKDIKNEIIKLNIENPEEYERWVYYKATEICCDAAISYANRYAKLAREMCHDEANQKRKEELLLIAQNCERVPAYPARNVREALQSFWFTHLLLHYEVAGGAGIVAGRLDELLTPFIKEQNIKTIKKWLKNLWINYNQIMYFLPGRSAYVWSGHPISEQPTIAGIDKDFNDSSKAITRLILEIEKEVGLPQPDIAVMYHDKIDKRVLEKSCDTLLVSMKPKFFNYEICRQQAINKGIREEDLIDLVDIGCVASGPQGKSWGNNGIAFFNLCKIVELVLNNGVDPLKNKKIGIETGDPSNFVTFKEFLDAYEKQLQYALKMTIIMCNIIEDVHTSYNPQPFASILIDDCLDKGIPLWKGGARYSKLGIEAVGLANVADSLAVIKKLVFEEKNLKMSDLLIALSSNFDGNWKTLQNKIKKVPKFGNDNDFVDELAVKVVDMFANNIKEFKCKRGNYCPSLASVSAHLGLGKFIGATPDGRFSGQPLADGMSPTQGVCKNGPTAVIKSAVKIDHSKITDGTLLNMKFNSSILKNPDTREKFIDLIRTYMHLGGYHVQFNITDSEKLKDAQKHPEKYPDLLVRVAAYVAQFRHLPKELQNDIIRRSELGID